MEGKIKGGREEGIVFIEKGIISTFLRVELGLPHLCSSGLL